MKTLTKVEMKKNWWFLAAAAIFLLFGLVQLNDPDPLWWTVIYLAAAVSYVGYFFGLSFVRWLALVGFVVATIWAITLIPPFISWLKMGAPTIVGSMKATEPHIEFVREFLGLVLLMAGFGWFKPWRRHIGRYG